VNTEESARVAELRKSPEFWKMAEYVAIIDGAARRDIREQIERFEAFREESAAELMEWCA